jgi:putative flippase GtrA
VINVALFHLFSLFDVWYIFTKIFIIGIVLCWNFGANTFWTFNVKPSSSNE